MGSQEKHPKLDYLNITPSENKIPLHWEPKITSHQSHLHLSRRTTNHTLIHMSNLEMSLTNTVLTCQAKVIHSTLHQPSRKYPTSTPHCSTVQPTSPKSSRRKARKKRKRTSPKQSRVTSDPPKRSTSQTRHAKWSKWKCRSGSAPPSALA